MKEVLKQLCNLNGISGNEGNVADFCVNYLSNYANVTKDFNNNVIAVLGNTKSEKTILLDAHLDQIGLIITDIDSNGFIKVDKCGGVDFRTLLGSPVTVHGEKELKGIICCMPPHLSDGNEDEAPTIDNIFIDLGLPYDEVKQLVSCGDYISLDSKFSELLNGRISCSSLDNRAGIATLFEVCKLLCNTDLNFKVVILLSSQEETYATGAITKAYEISPDEAICVDVSFANQIGIDGQYSNVKLGGGPMVCFSSTLNRNMSEKLIELAEKNNIPFQYEVCGGRTGTNADHISTSKHGVKTAVVSIPQRNMHTQVEVIDINDIKNTAKLLAEYIISGGVC